MKQDDAARLRFIENTGKDMEELLALVRSIHRKLTQVIDQAGGKTARRDLGAWPAIRYRQSRDAVRRLRTPAPWAYDRVMDLRSVMRLAGIKSEDVDSSGFVSAHCDRRLPIPASLLHRGDEAPASNS